jgi:hypothetical protein
MHRNGIGGASGMRIIEFAIIEWLWPHKMRPMNGVLVVNDRSSHNRSNDDDNNYYYNRCTVISVIVMAVVVGEAFAAYHDD